MKERVQEVYIIAGAIEPHLAGHDPGVQGAVLAMLLAKWLAGHHGIDRDVVLADHIVGVKGMVPAILKEHGMLDA